MAAMGSRQIQVPLGPCALLAFVSEGFSGAKSSVCLRSPVRYTSACNMSLTIGACLNMGSVLTLATSGCKHLGANTETGQFQP